MSFKDDSIQYGRISRFNHILLALLMIGAIAFGLYIEDLPRGPEKFEMIGLHKSFGVLILFLGLWRIFWRLKSGFLKPADGVSKVEFKLGHTAHILLLILIFLMPMSGYVMSEAKGYAVSFFGLFEMPPLPDNKAVGDFARQAHDILGTVAIVLISLHVLAALKHHFINKDNTLLRMFGKPK